MCSNEKLEQGGFRYFANFYMQFDYLTPTDGSDGR